MAYLQQISTTSKPVAAKKQFSLNPKILIGVGIAVVVLIFFIVIASMLGNVTDKEKEEAIRLNIRTNYLLSVLDDYTNSVKSSNLRSMGATLSTHLTELNRDLLPILTAAWGYEDWEQDSPPEILEEETEFIRPLVEDLENARLNGLLDRVYVRELALQIALFNSIQSEVIARTEKEDLAALLEKSLTNLRELHTQFSDYSDRSN